MRSTWTFLSFLFLFAVSVLPVLGQNSGTVNGVQKRLGIARIQVFASIKGTPIAEVSKLPLFFGPASDEYKYKSKNLLEQQPPTTGDTIRELTSDSMAVFFKRDLYSMSGYGDKGGRSQDRRNIIHDLPTENPQKMAVDSVFDEAIDIACYWTFQHSAVEPDRYIPSVQMRMEIYNRSGQAEPEKVIYLKGDEIRTQHFEKDYGVGYDFVKGIKLSEIEKGGVAGNVVVDVYLQALNKLLAKNK